MSGDSYRLDETYAKVGKVWKCLYRAVDKDSATISRGRLHTYVRIGLLSNA
jgi:transposase-like protein